MMEFVIQMEGTKGMVVVSVQSAGNWCVCVCEIRLCAHSLMKEHDAGYIQMPFSK